MAKKGKKKKFYRKRAAGVARRVYRGARKRFKRRSTSLGFVGKVGIGVAAGAPIVGSALEAADTSLGVMRANSLGVMGTAKVAFWSFLNNLSSGFGPGNLVTNVVASKSDGTRVVVSAGAVVPTGVWFKTATVGAILLAWDIGVSWAARTFAKVHSGVRFMGTKITGGR